MSNHTSTVLPALGHLRVRGLRSGNEDSLPVDFAGKLQRPPALARPGAANNQDAVHVRYHNGLYPLGLWKIETEKQLGILTALEARTAGS